MIFHGKTFTSKVSLYDVCSAIAKYGFVASPYPIIISAEMHCSVTGQESVVKIMKDIFGDALISAPIGTDRDAGSEGSFDRLPSPEELRGRILFKVGSYLLCPESSVFIKDSVTQTKNLDLEKRESAIRGGDSREYSSTTETSSASDSDAAFEQPQQTHGRRIKRVMDSDAVKGVSILLGAIFNPQTVYHRLQRRFSEGRINRHSQCHQVSSIIAW